MPKKVIFIGGTSYSGSTFFHLTLANDPHGFGTGEVRHLFWPEKQRHVSASWKCGCGDPECTYWARVKQRGEQHLYESIFEFSPEVDFIVDSSKNVIWVEQQSNRLAQQGIEVYHLVIWKTLLEFAHSLHKRNRLHKDKGLGNWPRYHRLYNTFIQEWRAVKYSDYTGDQLAVLEAVCNHLGIPYFAGKERFWEKTHHVLGGNLSSRIHLYSKESDGYQDVRRRTEESKGTLDGAESHHRKVYYEKPDPQVLDNYIRQIREESPYVEQVEQMLIDYDVTKPATMIGKWSDLRIGTPEKTVRQIRHTIIDHLNRVRYRSNPSQFAGAPETHEVVTSS